MPTKSSGFLIQSTYGSNGNFEAVFPGRQSGLLHFWRDNDAPNFPWSTVAVIDPGTFDEACLIQSNFGTPGLGNLEVIARQGANLVHFWRDDQTRWYCLVTAAYILGIAAWQIWANDRPVMEAIRSSSFNVVSVITTTGFASEDYLLWGTMPMTWRSILRRCRGTRTRFAAN